MLIQRICIAFRGEGNPKAVATLAIARAAKDVDNWNAKKALILKKKPTVSFVAITIVREHFYSISFVSKKYNFSSIYLCLPLLRKIGSGSHRALI